jgi:hypothetical protein
MAILLMNGERYCKLLTPLSYRVGVLPQDNMREHVLEELYEDSTVLDISEVKESIQRAVWNKYGNGMGSTDDAPTFVEAFILSGAKEVK